MKTFCLIVTSTLLGLLAGCAVQTAPITHQPMSMRPQPVPAAVPTDGSIFQAASFRPMFEDRSPVRVGDILTVTIRESNKSATAEDTEGSHDSSIDGGIAAGSSLPFIPGAIERKLGGLSLSGSGSAVRRLKWHVNWVQNVARQFGPYLWWALVN